ncbi:Forkhead-associated (FHA) domain, partial [Trinorchestia longiramus]
REQWGHPQEVKNEAEAEPEEKTKVNLGLSGKLAEDTNTYKGVVIKYSQPAEARKPKRRWRWYIFKGEEELPYLPLHRQSAYLIGRERRVVDVPTDHPSCSKQHAVLQYRLVRYTRDDNTTGRTVKPYIIDLDSANGTYVNNRRITPRSYVELMEKDVVKFGYSSREYVLLHETSKDSDVDTADAGLDMSPVSALMS